METARPALVVALDREHGRDHQAQVGSPELRVRQLESELAGVRVPAPWHVLGPALIYLFNRYIVTRSLPPPGPLRTFRRAYTGVAFTSLFGLLFLIATPIVINILLFLLGSNSR